MKLNHDSPPTEKGELFGIHVLWPFLLPEPTGSHSQQGSAKILHPLLCKQGKGMSKLLVGI